MSASQAWGSTVTGGAGDDQSTFNAGSFVFSLPDVVLVQHHPIEHSSRRQRVTRPVTARERGRCLRARPRPAWPARRRWLPASAWTTTGSGGACTVVQALSPRMAASRPLLAWAGDRSETKRPILSMSLGKPRVQPPAYRSRQEGPENAAVGLRSSGPDREAALVARASPDCVRNLVFFPALVKPSWCLN